MRSRGLARAVVVAVHGALLLAPPSGADAVIRTIRSPHAQSGGRFGWCVAPPHVAQPCLWAVGAPRESADGVPEAGMVYVFDSADGALLDQLSAADPQVRGRFGFAVALPGDLDADGEGDLIIGAPHEDGIGDVPDAGRVHVVSGGSGATIVVLCSPEPEPSGLFGWSVLALGDVTGDGVADFAVGAPGETPDQYRSNAGRVYVVGGADGAVIRAIDPPVLVADGRFGSAMAALTGAAGCVVAIGVPTADDSAAGAVFLFDGNGALQSTLVSPQAVLGGRFGAAVACADVDADGEADLVVGAPGERGGTAYAFDVEDGTLLATFVHETPGDGAFFGRTVAPAGDVDGDGIPDVAVSGLTGGSDGMIGQVQVHRATGEPVATLVAPDPSGSSFGWSIAPVGDADGDGRGDLAVGAYGAFGEEGQTEAGCVYLVRPSPAEGLPAPEELQLRGPWPNPARDVARLFVPGVARNALQSGLYDGGGRQVTEATVTCRECVRGVEVDLHLPAAMSSGAYCWRLTLGARSTSVPLIVVR